MKAVYLASNKKRKTAAVLGSAVLNFFNQEPGRGIGLKIEVG
jgi:hypothetical protein